MANLYVGATGAKIVIDVGILVDEINVARVRIRKPSGDEIDVNASKEDSTTNIYFVTSGNEFDVAGEYELQPYVETVDGFKGYGDVAKIVVGGLV